MRGNNGVYFILLIALLAIHVNGILPRTSENHGAVFLGESTAAGPAAAPMASPAAAAPVTAVAIKKMLEVKHIKEKGGMYKEGSPLYDKQQDNAPKPLPKEAPPVSTTMNCVTNLISLFFIVSTALFIVQTVNSFANKMWDREEKCLICAKETVMFAPMLCVLFIATRMRALSITKGNPDAYDLPQWWVQVAMQVCCWSVVAQTILALACSALYGEDWEDLAKRNGMSAGEKVLTVVKYIVMLGIYAGFTTVAIGLVVMEGPEEIWGSAGAPSIPPAFFCTIFLVILYFSVYLALAIAKTVNESGFMGQRRRFGLAQEPLKNATTTMSSAAMLCILFLAARMRANQVDVEPQSWAKGCFMVCTASIFVQALLAVGGGLLGVQQKTSESGNLEASGSSAAKAIQAVWTLAVLCLYAAIIGIFISVYLLENKQGHTTDVSPTVQNVMFLTIVYFSVYMVTWIVFSMERMGMKIGEAVEKDRGIKAFLKNRAKDAVDFCPMLCVLFVGVRMRALQITNNQGAPQGWVQLCMWIASWSVLFQIIARLDTLILEPPKWMSTIAALLQYFFLLITYGCVVGVVVGLYTMTPQNANGDSNAVHTLDTMTF